MDSIIFSALAGLVVLMLVNSLFWFHLGLKYHSRHKYLWIVADILWLVLGAAALISAIYAVKESLDIGRMKLAQTWNATNRDAIVLAVNTLENGKCKEATRKQKLSQKAGNLCNSLVPLLRQKLSLTAFSNIESDQLLKTINGVCGPKSCPKELDVVKATLKTFGEYHFMNREDINGNLSDGIVGWLEIKFTFIGAFILLFGLRLGRSSAEWARTKKKAPEESTPNQITCDPKVRPTNESIAPNIGTAVLLASFLVCAFAYAKLRNMDD